MTILETFYFSDIIIKDHMQALFSVMNIYSIVCILHCTKNILKEKSAFVTVYEAVGELIFFEVLVISISYSWIEYLHGNVRAYYYITLIY